MKIRDRLSRWLPGFFPRRPSSPVDRLDFTLAAQAEATHLPTRHAGFFSVTWSRDDNRWAFEEISLKALRKMPPEKRRRVLSYSSSAMSKMISDWTIAINQGWWYTPDVTRPQASPRRVVQVIESFLKHLEREWGSLETAISQLSDSLILHGSTFSELVFSDNGLVPRRLLVLPPDAAAWQESPGPDGAFYELGQRHKPTFGRSEGEFKSLHRVPTVQFRCLFPIEDMPWGRAPLDPAMREIGNKEELAGNLQKFASTTAWPSVLFLIHIDELIKKLGNTTNPQEISAEIIRLRQQIKADFEKLGPASAMIYSSDVSADMSISGLSRQNLGYITDMYRDLDRDILVGGKAPAVFHNRQEGIAERHAVVQLLGYDRFVRRGQLLLEDLLSYYFNLILTVEGLPALSQFHFVPANKQELREASETLQLQAEAKLRAAEAQQQMLMTLRDAVTAGYMSQEDAYQTYDAFRLELQSGAAAYPQRMPTRRR